MITITSDQKKLMIQYSMQELVKGLALEIQIDFDDYCFKFNEEEINKKILDEIKWANKGGLYDPGRVKLFVINSFKIAARNQEVLVII